MTVSVRVASAKAGAAHHDLVRPDPQVGKAEPAGAVGFARDGLVGVERGAPRHAPRHDGALLVDDAAADAAEVHGFLRRGRPGQTRHTPPRTRPRTSFASSTAVSPRKTPWRPLSRPGHVRDPSRSGPPKPVPAPAHSRRLARPLTGTRQARGGRIVGRTSDTDGTIGVERERQREWPTAPAPDEQFGSGERAVHGHQREDRVVAGAAPARRAGRQRPWRAAAVHRAHHGREWSHEHSSATIAAPVCVLASMTVLADMRHAQLAHGRQQRIERRTRSEVAGPWPVTRPSYVRQGRDGGGWWDGGG